MDSNNANGRLSRVLAALDNASSPTGSSVPGNIFASTHLNPGVKHSLQTPTSATGSKRENNDANLKKRRVGDVQAHLALLSQSPRKGSGGFQINYDDKTPISRLDVGGEDQDLRMAEFVTKSIDNLSNGLTVQGAMNMLNLQDKKDILPGLEVRLLAHQLIGVSWMVDQERNSPHKGGILADDMGLGKTVQMIATMAMNMPDLNDSWRTTLIVVPSALLQQWKDEIDTKTNNMFTVHLHHGRDKLKTLAAVQSKDVIITTYQTLNTDFSVPSDIGSDEEMEWLAHHGGILARARYYRCVLDEAQFIRNRATRSSKSVAMLRSKYRWLLTGTPITNSLADIYGLLRFGRFRPWNDWNDFNEYIAKVQVVDAPLAGERAQEILKPLLLRRTKNCKLDGKPILELPPRHIDITMLDFSVEERDLYDSFEKRTKIRLSKFIRERTLVQNHAVVLVMILRLRQLCCHPNLILSLTDGYEDPTLLVGSDGEKELGRAKKVMGLQWVTDVKKCFMTRARATELLDFSDEGDEPDATCPVCHDLYINDSGRVLACGHEICFDCLLDLSNSAIAHDGEFGHGNEQENIRAEKEYEVAAAKGLRPCPTCKKMNDLTPAKVFKSSAFEPSDEELTNYACAIRRNSRRSYSQKKKDRRRDDEDEDEDEDVDSDDGMLSPPLNKPFEKFNPLIDSDDDLPDMAHMLDKTEARAPIVEDDDDVIDLTMDDISLDITPSNSQSKRKGKAALKRKGSEETRGPSDATIATWRKGDDDLEPSAKMLALITLLKESDPSGDKTICYSQWTSMLDLIEILFSRHGIQSLRYDGKMDRAVRDSTLAIFKKIGGPKVILISTKCGGVGLNLVSANRIINMDLSWNYASEQQAYDRAFRIGQEKEVFVKRLVVRNTIEERMLRLQDVKVELTEVALGEGTGGKLHKLSIKDIKQLFGMSSKPEEKTHATQSQA